MARPAKAISATTGARTKEELAYRKEVENALRGDSSPICPDYLTVNQKNLFNEISTFYADQDLLSSLDASSLAAFCVAVDRLQSIEAIINAEPEEITNSKLMSARKQYEATMWRGCSEFCLSPQSRAKIGSLAMTAKKDAKDPLAEALAID